MKKLIPSLAAAALLAGTASAALYVDFGGNYVSTNVAFNRTLTTSPVSTGALGGTSTQDVYTVLPIDFATSLSPASGYTGPTFYGGGQSIRYDSFGTSSSNGITSRVHENGLADLWRVQWVAPGSIPAQLVYATLFSKSDFINGGSAVSVTLDGTSSISLTVNAFNTLPAASSLRFLIQEGSQLYVSNATASLASGSAATFSLSGTGLTSATWAPYSPTGTNLLIPTGGFTSQTFANITAVGFVWDANATASGQTWNLTVSDFEFTAIPEPSTYAALAGAAAVALAFWRRRRS